MKLIKMSLLLIVVQCLSSLTAFSQKIEHPDGSTFVERESPNAYKKVVNGYLYRFDADGLVWVITAGPEGERTFKAATIRRSDDNRIFFYDAISQEYKGSYEPSTNSFVLPKHDIAANFVGTSKLVDAANNTLFLIDGAVGNEVLGFFLYFRY